jgi:ribosomal protein S14
MHLSNFKKYDITLMEKLELKKNVSKMLLSGCFDQFKSLRFHIYLGKHKYFSKYGSISYFRRSCIYSGICRSVFRKFKLSRYKVKFYSSYGLLNGLRKASF